MSFNLQFSRVSELRDWLQRKSEECGDPESYDEWLRNFFSKGNTISVRGEEHDYWSCWELI